MRTPDLFPGTKPRAQPRKLMHVCDASGCGDEDGSGALVRMRCTRCGAETGWITLPTVTEAKRGIPCEQCNRRIEP